MNTSPSRLCPPLRALRHGSQGQLVMSLEVEDLKLAQRCGEQRFAAQRGGRNFDGACRKGQGALNDIEGALGEIAAWLLHGIQPPSEMVLSLPEWDQQRGPNGGRLKDVLGLEIRTTTHKNGGLFVHKESSRDGVEKDNTPFVLVVLNRTDSKFDPEVTFAGWAYSYEAQERHYRHDLPVPEYLIPQQELRWMSGLADGRFMLPAVKSKDFDVQQIAI